LKRSSRYILFSGLLVTIVSCQFLGLQQGEETEGSPLARVYDKYLYREDVVDLVPEGIPEVDSLIFIQNYVNTWAGEQLLILKAEYNLTEEQKNFEDQIREYRNDLLKFAYQQEYVRQKLDTTITEAEVQDFYEKNGDNFLLKENILKTRYVILRKETPGISDAEKWFKSNDKDNRKKVLDYSLKYAARFSLEDTSWTSFDELASIIPLETYNQSEFLLNNRFVELADSSKVYWLEVVDYKIKDSNSPLPYVRSIIKNVIINRRKLELLENLEKSLLNDALEKKEFETF